MEHIQNQTIGLGDDRVQFGIHQSGEDNGLNPVFTCRLVDAADGFMGFFYAIHKGDANMLKGGFKLGQNRLAKVLSGNASAV